MAAVFTINRAITPDAIDATMQEFIVDGFITLTGNYGGAATNGDTLSFAGVEVPSNQLNWVEIMETPPAGTAPTGYTFGFAPGTTNANGVLTVMNGTTQYTQGSAYSAGQLAAVLRCRAWWVKYL
jgi:hypothetical protein